MNITLDLNDQCNVNWICRDKKDYVEFQESMIQTYSNRRLQFSCSEPTESEYPVLIVVGNVIYSDGWETAHCVILNNVTIED